MQKCEVVRNYSQVGWLIGMFVREKKKNKKTKKEGESKGISMLGANFYPTHELPSISNWSGSRFDF